MGIRDMYAGLTPATMLWRDHLLSLLGDWDRVLKGARADTYLGREYDEPIGGWREIARPCTHCKGPTQFTTPRGRSVHPGCEGYLDTLTDDGLNKTLRMVTQIIPISRIEEELCPYDPAHTLAVPARTDNRPSPETESANGAGVG